VTWLQAVEAAVVVVVGGAVVDVVVDEGADVVDAALWVVVVVVSLGVLGLPQAARTTPAHATTASAR